MVNRAFTDHSLSVPVRARERGGVKEDDMLKGGLWGWLRSVDTKRSWHNDPFGQSVVVARHSLGPSL